MRAFPLLTASALTLCACDMTRLALPAHPSAANCAAANAGLAGRPAVVTLRDGDDIKRETVLAAQFDREGSLGVCKTEVVENQAHASRSACQWTRVPSDSVIEISTIDRQSGAMKGFLVGGLVGLVPTTIGFYAAIRHPSCASSGFDTVCSEPSVGGTLAIGVLIGLGVALVTGGIGAAMGSAIGDGADITMTPYTARP